MKNLTDEVYKRRLLNALVSGAAIYYSSNFEFYIKDLFKINPKLPLLYKSIHDINTILLYERKNISTKNSGGCVEVYISNGENQVNINAKGLFLPTLLEETIKGILELAISHGLPKDRKKAQYIIGKSDFKLADIWDMRIGLPLWLVIKDLCDELGYDPIKIGVNFIFMELSTLEPPKFNNVMSEIFGKTNKGKNILKNLLQYIEKEKQNDEFDDYVSNKNNDYQINDGVYYTVDELKNDIF